MQHTLRFIILLFVLASGCKSPQDSPTMVNWQNLEDRLVLAAQSVLSDAARKHADERFYGMVIEISQNWALEIHLNTEAGIIDGISSFRKDSVGYEKKSDSEIATMLGRWYFQSWKYSYLSMTLDSALTNLNEENYSIFEQIANQGNGGEVQAQFMKCASRAAERIILSEGVSGLPRTQDFIAKVADEDGLEFYTKKRLQ